MSQHGPDQELLAEEERPWTELHDLVDSLPPDKVGEPGYFDEGWSAKDRQGEYDHERREDCRPKHGQRHAACTTPVGNG